MSKKSKRQVSRQAPRSVSVPVTRTTEFNPDYSTTKHELRRIGILAGSFFVVLVVLAIFQNQLLGLFMK
jgi:hypothetical protein